MLRIVLIIHAIFWTCIRNFHYRQAEQDFIVQQLPKLKLSGSEDFWIGASDWEVDGTIKWVDGKVITQDSYQNFPNHQVPSGRTGEVECASVYVGKKILLLYRITNHLKRSEIFFQSKHLKVKKNWKEIDNITIWNVWKIAKR